MHIDVPVAMWVSVCGREVARDLLLMQGWRRTLITAIRDGALGRNLLVRGSYIRYASDRNFEEW